MRRPARWRALEAANRRQRSTPALVSIEVSVAASAGPPRWTVPPAPTYTPSVFSRTTTRSMSSGLTSASGDATPGYSLTGLKFT